MDPIDEPRYQRERVTEREPAAGPTVPSAGPVVARTYDPRAERVIWFLVSLIDALIAMRFFMRLLGANYGADFVRFIYGVTAPLVAPFRAIFPQSGNGNYVLEPESLVAIVIYSLIAWALVALLRIMLSPRRRPELP